MSIPTICPVLYSNLLTPEVLDDKAGYTHASGFGELPAHVLEKHVVVDPLMEAFAPEEGSVGVFEDFLQKQGFELRGGGFHVPADLLSVAVRIG